LNYSNGAELLDHLSDPSKTLNDKVIDKAMSKIIAELQSKVKAELR
jgi:phenylalanyl-tRNA synthetase beta subunit